MRIAKFDVPAEVLAEFIDAVCDKELKSTIVSRTEDEYNIEIDFDKNDVDKIDELEEELDSLIDNIEEENDEEE